jgi:hypothetical protein
MVATEAMVWRTLLERCPRAADTAGGVATKPQEVRLHGGS